jgi:5-methylcytosine-specific restriction protein A
MAVAIQPAGNEFSRKHYQDTVENLVNLEKYRSFLGSDSDDLFSIAEAGSIALWGVTPGTNGVNISKYQKLEPGDTVLFTRKGFVYSSGTITHLFHNKDFAKTLWNEDSKGQTWEYMYSLAAIQSHEIPYQILRDAIGSDEGDNFMGFRVLDGEKSDAALEILNRPNTTFKRVTERGPQDPPYIGERFKNRHAIWKAYGGQKQQGAAIFPGENYLNIFSDADGPYPDFINEESGVIEYRGQGLTGAQTLTRGNKLLEDARISKAPVRFWHKPINGEWIFKSWVIVADRTTISENDVDNQKSLRFIWFLAPVESEDSTKWSQDLALAPVLELPIEEPASPSNYELLLKNYSKLSKGFADESVGVITGAKPVRRFKRSREARDLVIARSEFKCEYDKCTGMPPDVDSQGKPILQVDHIVPLSEGGSDRPSNMIAICPNCHVAKTIGFNKKRIAKEFLKIVGSKEQLLNKALN